MSRWRTQSSDDPKPADSEREGTGPEPTGPKYPRPKVIVIDAPDIYEALRGRGYAATRGTFGQPRNVAPAAGYIPLKLSGELPGYPEQEIVIADLAGPEPMNAELDKTDTPPPGVEALWVSLGHGQVDPRPAVMSHVRSEGDRILRHGGVFVLFAAPLTRPEYVYARRSPYDGGLDPHSSVLNADNWSLLSELQWLAVSADFGEEMDAADNVLPREFGIDKYFNNGHFDCTIGLQRDHARWITLATNKYGDPVAGVIVPSEKNKDTAGLIFVFPQLDRRAELAIDLMENVLPRLRPRLFPHSEGSRWTRRAEYELPRVAALRTEIARLEEEARVRVGELEEKIQEERTEYSYLHDLVTATGESLVQAVARTLKTLGFNDVQDVDAEARANGDSGNLREDLRIMDARVPVLVEIKGIAGLPKEASSLQVGKYLIPRMRDWENTKLRGLAIVNHQRNLPALERENEHVFQPDVVSNAEELGFGLLTAWDLFRLARGFLAHGWHHDDIAELFVTPGRVRPIPAHYEFIGLVDGFWPQVGALGIRLELDSLTVGDRIAYELPVDFVEEEISSLQVDQKDSGKAEPGDYPGVKTKLNKDQARKNVKVYKVNARETENR